jgi:hypothetical protein
MSASLLGNLLGILENWKVAFAQRRTHERAVEQAVAGLCCNERRTLSRLLQAKGSSQQDWSADYRLHSRSRWKTEQLFAPTIAEAQRLCGHKYIAVAFDDTKVRKSGKRIPGASFWVDPIGPKFRVQLLWGLRFLQASILVPAYKRGGLAARGIPAAFTEVPAVKRPKRGASQEECEAYRKAVRENNLSTAFVAQLKLIRQQLDGSGAESKLLIAVVDGSFCNRTCMRAQVERTVIVGRARKDAKLCYPSTEVRRTYDTKTFTPEDVRQDETIPWKIAKVFHGKRYRSIRYKEVTPILWRGGTGKTPVRLIVLAPTRYTPKRAARVGKRGKKLKHYYYRRAGYLLCTDLQMPAAALIQHYFDRWQIEVNHKEEKDTLGVGEAQLRSSNSVSRQPALAVATYSALILAAIKTYGYKNNENLSRTKWYKGANRATARDLVTTLRAEIEATARMEGKNTPQGALKLAILMARSNSIVQT